MTVVKIVPMPGVPGAKGDKGDSGNQGVPGENGLPGASAYQIAVGHGFSGNESDWINSLKGEKGDAGDPGEPGSTGLTGASAYQLAISHGYEGSEEEWLASLTAGSNSPYLSVDSDSNLHISSNTQGSIVLDNAAKFTQGILFPEYVDQNETTQYPSITFDNNGFVIDNGASIGPNGEIQNGMNYIKGFTVLDEIGINTNVWSSDTNHGFRNNNGNFDIYSDGGVDISGPGTINISSNDSDIILNADGSVYLTSSTQGNQVLTEGYINAVIGDTSLINPSTGHTITDVINNISLTPGPQGPAGIGFTFRGAWNDVAYFSANDIVTIDGGSFVAIQNSVAVSPYDTSYWSPIASKGDQGPQGDPGTPGVLDLSYGSFYDTNSFGPYAANSVQAFSFETTDFAKDVHIGGINSSQLVITKTGKFNIAFSAQFHQTNSSGVINIWLRKNDVDVPWTNTKLDITSNNPYVVAAWNLFVDATENDYFEIVWSSTSNHTILEAVPAGSHPGVPSVIATVNQVGV